MNQPKKISRAPLFQNRRSQPTMKDVVGWYGQGKTVEDYLKEYKEKEVKNG